MSGQVTSTEHVVLLAVASAGEGGTPRAALLASEVVSRTKSGNGAVKLLAEKVGVAAAERQMRGRGAQAAFEEFVLHTADELVAAGRLVDTDGVLTLGKMPRGYDPIRYETTERQATATMNIVAARRKTKGWTYYVNPDLDEAAVASLAETMERTGWPKGHTVLLDADGNVADGKHHIAAAERVGIDWREHTRTIPNEIELWQAVKSRNLDRWSMTKTEIAKRRAQFLALRPDLTVQARLDSLREAMAEVAPSTQRRVTAEVKAEVRAERDQEIAERKAAGQSQRQIAVATGVPKSTVDRVPQNARSEQNGAPPAPVILGLCPVCKTDVTKDERYGHPIAPAPGYIIGLEVRPKRPGKTGGGGNKILGPYTKDADTFVHETCFVMQAQDAYRGR